MCMCVFFVLFCFVLFCFFCFVIVQVDHQRRVRSSKGTTVTTDRDPLTFVKRYHVHYTYTYIQVYIHVYIHTCTYTCTYTYTHSVHTHTYTHSHHPANPHPTKHIPQTWKNRAGVQSSGIDRAAPAREAVPQVSSQTACW
jgi:hypothetical protein